MVLFRAPAGNLVMVLIGVIMLIRSRLRSLGCLRSSMAEEKAKTTTPAGSSPSDGIAGILAEFAIDPDFHNQPVVACTRWRIHTNFPSRFGSSYVRPFSIRTRSGLPLRIDDGVEWVSLKTTSSKLIQPPVKMGPILRLGVDAPRITVHASGARGAEV